MIEVLILKKYFEFQLIDYGFVKTMVFTQLKQTISLVNSLTVESIFTRQLKSPRCLRWTGGKMCCVPSLIVWLFSNYGSGRRTRYHLCQRGAAPPAPGPGPGTTLTNPSQPMRHKHKIISTTSIWTGHRQKANKKEKAHTQRMLVLRSKLSVCFALHFSSTCDLLHWELR